MAKSVGEILTSKQIRRVISRVKKAINPISTFLGMQIGGPNRLPVGGRKSSYDTFDNTRRIAKGRAPGVSNARSKPQVVGNVDIVFPRAAETIELSDEAMLNFRSIGGPVEGGLSASAESYITRQEVFLGQKFNNVIEFQAAAMLRGSYVFKTSGDDLYHDFTGTGITIDFQIPSGNLTGLNMLGGGNLIDGPWSTAATDIPAQIYAINAAMIQLTGDGLRHILCNSTVWNNVLNNTVVQGQGGSANLVFERIDIDENNNFEAVLRAIPWLRWHILDHGLDVGIGDGSYTKLLPDGFAAFTPEPSSDWVQYQEGSEFVTEGPNGTRAVRMGFYPYAYPTHDPSGWDLAAVQNGLPALYIPSAIAFGNVETAA